MVFRARLLLVPLAMVLVAVVWPPSPSVVHELPRTATTCAVECVAGATSSLAAVGDGVAQAADAACIRSVECAGAVGAVVALALAVVVVAGLARPADGVPVPVRTTTRLRSGRQPSGGIYRPPRPGSSTS